MAEKKKKSKKAEEAVIEEAEEEPPATLKKKKKRQVEAAEDAEAATEETPKKKQKGGEAVEASAPGTRLYLSGVPKNCTIEVLTERFSQYGKVKDVVLPPGKGAKRIAFVTFKKAAVAQAALQEDGGDIEGSQLKVRLADGSKGKDNAAPDKVRSTTVFVAGLGLDCKEKAVRKLFSGCGDIEQLDLPASKAQKGMTRGFAVVKFKALSAADAALELNESEYKGRTLSVKPYTQSASDERKASKLAAQKAKKEAIAASNKEFRIFVRGFPKPSSEESIKEHFEPCGKIRKLVMPKKKDGSPRDIAFISFDSKAAMKEALRLDGQEFREKPLIVTAAGSTLKKGAGGAGGE